MAGPHFETFLCLRSKFTSVPSRDIIQGTHKEILPCSERHKQIILCFLLFVFVDGDYPSTQTLGCRRCILDFGGVKVRIGDILIAYFCDVGLWNVVLHKRK